MTEVLVFAKQTTTTTGSLFASYSKIPYIGEPPREVRAFYFLCLAIGGTIQHGFRLLPKVLTKERQSQIFAAVLAPVPIMLSW